MIESHETNAILYHAAFSPGSGVEVIKELRFLFARFFFWCMVPAVEDSMEGCPEKESLNILYMVLSGVLGLFLFLMVQVILKIRKGISEFEAKTRNEGMMDTEFQELQVELYGEKNLRRLLHDNSSRSIGTTDQNKASAEEP